MELKYCDLLTELYQKHNKALFNTAYSILGDNELANDVVAETYTLAAYKIEILYNHPQKAAWLYKVMYNKIKEIYHTRFITDSATGERTKITEVQYENIEYFMNALTENPYDKIVDEIDGEELLGKYKKPLNNTEYKFIKQRFIEDKTLFEVADELDISYDSSRHLWSRIKKKIKNFLNNS